MGDLRTSLFAYVVIGVVACLYSAAKCDEPRPNILLVNLDDADFQMLNLDFTQNERTYFPRIKELARRGVRFNNTHVTTPICGPSRACLLRGQYARNTGIRVNDPRQRFGQGYDGGYLKYKELGHTQNDLSTWIKDEGYRTYFVGKYLHPGLGRDVPEGWDEFVSYAGSRYLNTTKFVNGKADQANKELYRTTREADDCLEILKNHKPLRENDGTPFFLYWAPFAPHAPGSKLDPDEMVEQKFSSLWSDLNQPATPNLFEDDTSDKPHLSQLGKPNSFYRQEFFRQRFLRRMRGMKSFDVQFGRLMRQLEKTKELENTYVVLTSDNGVFLCRHRLFGKQFNYDAATRVPLIVSGPGVAQDVDANHLIGHIDIAPTLVNLVDGQIPDFVDGISFKSLLEDPSRIEETDWREFLLIENWQSREHTKYAGFAKTELRIHYSGLRLFDESFTDWTIGIPEYYDLKTDPYQVDNSILSLPTERLEKLQNTIDGTRMLPSKPTIVVSSPFDEVVRQSTQIFGYSEAAKDLDEVKVQLENKSDRVFWNGKEWQDSPTFVDAKLRGSDPHVVQWKLQFPNEEFQSGKLYSVKAIAIDTDGNESDESATRTFEIDDSDPETIINSPVDGEAVPKSFVIQGTASDDKEVLKIILYIKNLVSNKYWADDQWVENKHFFVAEVLPSEDGTFKWELPVELKSSVKLRITARAYDTSMNFDPTPAVIKLERKK